MPPIFRRAENPRSADADSHRCRTTWWISCHFWNNIPDLDVVIDHMADCSPDAPDKLELLLNLARFPRVYVKISHTWSISQTGYPWADTFEQVKQVYQAFGGSRLMWGTDWPVCLSRASYSETLSVVRDEMDFFSPEDREWVLGKTALRLWRFQNA